MRISEFSNRFPLDRSPVMRLRARVDKCGMGTEGGMGGRSFLRKCTNLPTRMRYLQLKWRYP